MKLAERTRLCPPERTTHGRQRSTWNPRMWETRPARLSITRGHRPNSSNWHSCKLAPELKNTPTLVVPATANLSYRPFPHVPQRSIPVRRCKLRIRTAVPRQALSIQLSGTSDESAWDWPDKVTMPAAFGAAQHLARSSGVVCNKTHTHIYNIRYLKNYIKLLSG